MAAPLLQQTTPADNGSGVAVTANLVLTFDQIIKLGASGGLRIYKSDGTLVHTISITDASQVILESGQRPTKITINPSIDLQPGTGYYVLIDAGSIENRIGDDFAGISSPTAFNFTTAGSPPGGGDTTAPLLSSTTPADNATNVAASANLVLTFNESVQAGSGNIEIHKVSDSSIVKTIAVTDATQVSVSGNQLTINPTTDLEASTAYYVTMASGVVRDLANNNFAGISTTTAFNFTTASPPADSIAPTLSSTAPADNATNVHPGSNLVLTFSEAVKAGTGNIEIHNLDGTIARTVSITDTTQVTFSGSQLTINPSSNLMPETGYYVTMGSGLVCDLANNAYAGISSPTTFNFTTRETTPPTVVSTTPADNGVNVDVDANLEVTFSEAVKAGLSGSIHLQYNNGWIAHSMAVTDTTQVTFSGNQLILNPNIDLLEDTYYFVSIDPGVVRDLANNVYPGSPLVFDFYTTDPNAPLLIDTSPYGGETFVSAGANLQFWFNEHVFAEAGNIEIRNVSDNSIARTIAITDTSQISFDGNGLIVNPSSDLAFGGNYYVTLGSGVVVDRVGNPFAGISSPLTFSFTIEPSDMTGPYLTSSSPDYGATEIPIDADFVATFNEAVRAGIGSIKIWYNGNTVRTIDVTDTSQVTFSGNQIIIDPSVDLVEGILYSITWDTSAIRDLAGNYYEGGFPSAFQFKTADPTPPQLADTFPEHGATDVEVWRDLRLTFNEFVKAGSGNIEIRDALNGSIAQTIAITDASRVTFDGYEIRINPPADLNLAKTYYVTLASGVVLDLAGNPFAGIASPSTFSFSTPPNVVLGTPNIDAVTGSDANERIDGLFGLDVLTGGRGDDTYVIQNCEHGTTTFVLAWDPNIPEEDPDGYIHSFAPDAQVIIDLFDMDSDGLVDVLQANFLDTEGGDGGVTFATTRLGTPLQPGTYTGTERAFIPAPGAPGFDYRSYNFIGGQHQGSFTIHALEIDYSSGTPVLVRASITFDMDPYGRDSELRGVFNYGYAPAGQATHDVIVEAANGGTDTVESWVSYALAANVENLTLLGYGDLNGWGNELANVIKGNQYHNILTGAGGNDTLEGGFGDDTFNIVAGAGNDAVADFEAGSGGDVANLDGFAMNNFSALQAAMSQSGSNTILNLGGGQTLTFLDLAPADFEANDFSFLHLPGPLFVATPPTPPAPTPFTLPESGASTTTINGTRRADNLTGTAANNKIDGKQGNDTMTGLAGDDTYLVDSSGDKVIDSSGIDTVISSASSYTLANNVENLTLTGTITHTATGNGLNNLIIASARPDIINGGAGNDIIRAGTGACVLTGGAGNDIFDFDVMGSQKQIADFTAGQDLVDLRTLLTWYGGSNPVTDNAISLSAVAGGVLVSVKASAGGSLQSLVKLTGVNLGDLHVGSDILWDA